MTTHYKVDLTNEIKPVNYQPLHKDVVSLAIIGQTLLISYVVGIFVYFA